MLCRKVYQFRVYPTPSQERAMLRMAGACRWVWNWALARRKEHYEQTGKHLSFAVLSKELTDVRSSGETSWLIDLPRNMLTQALRNQDRAFSAFFNKNSRYPQFKSKKRSQPSFCFTQTCRVENGKVFIPKLGWVKIHQSQSIPEKTKTATFKRNACGQWHVTLVAEFDVSDGKESSPTNDNTVGVDAGLSSFAILSDGEKINNPRYFRKMQRKLRRAQRQLSRRKKGSNRRERAKRRVAKIHLKIANARSDFLHKLSTKIVRQYAGVCVEDLNLKGLVRTKLAKSFGDAAHGEFRRQLEYKCLWYRKHFVKIDRFFPSSKRCCQCGKTNVDMTMSDRSWTCPCGTVHDRDVNAAINIRDEGLRMLAVGDTESQNGRGVRVSPRLEAVDDEPVIASR